MLDHTDGSWPPHLIQFMKGIGSSFVDSGIEHNQAQIFKKRIKTARNNDVANYSLYMGIKVKSSQ